MIECWKLTIHLQGKGGEDVASHCLLTKNAVFHTEKTVTLLRYGSCIGVPCRDALVGLLDLIDKKDIFFLQVTEKSRKFFFRHSQDGFQNIRRALCILGRKTSKNLSELFVSNIEGVGSLDDTPKMNITCVLPHR